MSLHTAFACELTWPDRDGAKRNGRTPILIPCSIKQHGHHTPLQVDVRLPTEFARHGARRICPVNGHFENSWFIIEGIDLALRALRWDGVTEVKTVGRPAGASSTRRRSPSFARTVSRAGKSSMVGCWKPRGCWRRIRTSCIWTARWTWPRPAFRPMASTRSSRDGRPARAPCPRPGRPRSKRATSCLGSAPRASPPPSRPAAPWQTRAPVRISLCSSADLIDRITSKL